MRALLQAALAAIVSLFGTERASVDALLKAGIVCKRSLIAELARPYRPR